MIELVVLLKNMNFLILFHPYPHSPHLGVWNLVIYIFKNNYFLKFLMKLIVNSEIM